MAARTAGFSPWTAGFSRHLSAWVSWTAGFSRHLSVWLGVALLTALAPAQDTRPLVAELDRLVAAAKNPAPMAQAIALDLLAPVAQKIATENPEPTARDRRTMAAAVLAERVAMRGALAAACDRLESELAAALLSDDARSRRSALTILSAAGSAVRRFLPTLLRLTLTLGDDEAPDVVWTADAIGGLDREFVPGLAASLREPGPARQSALLALELLSDGSAPAVLGPVAAVVGGFLADPAEETRERAAWILFRVGASAAPAQASLRATALREPRSNTGQLAALALHRVDPRDAAAVPGLIEGLAPKTLTTRETVEALRDLGPAAAAALPKLLELLPHDDEAALVVRAIAAIDADGRVAIPVLIEGSSRASESTEFAIDELVRRAPSSVEARAWLEERLRALPAARQILDRQRANPADQDAVFQVFAALFEAAPDVSSFLRALRHGGYDCRRALPTMLKALDGKDEDLRAAARARVGMFGREAAPALAKLRVQMSSPQPGIRIAILHAMVKIDPLAEATLDDLIFRLADPDESVRIAALDALARLGKRAARAAPGIAFRLAETGGAERGTQAGTVASEQLVAGRALACVTGDPKSLPASIPPYPAPVEGPEDHEAAGLLVSPDSGERAPFALKLDPALHVCGGSWWSTSRHGDAHHPVYAWPELDPRGAKVVVVAELFDPESMCGPGPRPGVVLYLSRTREGRIEARGDFARFANWRPVDDSSPISSASIVLRSATLGRGTPLEALLTFEQDGRRVEVAFTCPDPFRRAE